MGNSSENDDHPSPSVGQCASVLYFSARGDAPLLAAEELEDARKIETREHELLAIVRSADDPLMDTSTRDDEDEIIECKLPGERFLGK